MNHYHLNVSYPYDGDFSKDNFVDSIVGYGAVAAGTGSAMLSFSGAKDGTWRDLEYVFDDDRGAQELMSELLSKLKSEMPDIDWRVTEMPNVD